jgi:hypothetical protein
MFKFMHDGMKTIPIPGGAANASIDDQVGGALGYLGIEVIHQAAESGFLRPALAAQLIAAGGANHWSGGDSHGYSFDLGRLGLAVSP